MLASFLVFLLRLSKSLIQLIQRGLNNVRVLFNYLFPVLFQVALRHNQVRNQALIINGSQGRLGIAAEAVAFPITLQNAVVGQAAELGLVNSIQLVGIEQGLLAGVRGFGVKAIVVAAAPSSV